MTTDTEPADIMSEAEAVELFRRLTPEQKAFYIEYLRALVNSSNPAT